MSDFLRHIVSRALGTAPVIQPRVLSRFESPGSGRTAGFVEERAEIIAPPPSPAGAAPRLSNPASPENPAPADARPALRSPAPSTTPPDRNAPAPDVERDTRLIADRGAVPAPAPAPPRAPGALAPIVSSPHPPAAVLQPAQSPAPMLPPIVNTLIVERAPEPTPVRPAPAIPAAIMPAPLQTRAVQETRAPAPLLAPTQPASPPPRDREPAMPPAIQVTIGRIEVRAVHPPAVPAARSPARGGPLVSLEDYLKQRTAS